jgi:diguanylate cyclase (GGDEF)-like protein
MLVFYVSILTLAAATAAVLGLYSWRLRQATGATAFTWLMLALVTWSMGMIFELVSPTIEGKIFWTRIEYIGIVILPAAWLMLSLRYSGLGRSLTWKRQALLSLEPVGILALVFLSDHHRLMWTSLSLVETPHMAALSVTYGPAFIFHAAYSYILLLSGTLLLVRTFLMAPQVYQRQSIILLGCIFVPWVGNLAYLMRLGPFAYLDVTPVTFALISPVLAWGVFRLRLLDLVPVAYDSLVEGMSDGILILDARDHVLYLNPAAEQILEQPSEDFKGSHSSKLPFPLPRPTDYPADRASEKTLVNFSVPKHHGLAYYQVNISPLYGTGRRTSGRIVILTNITHHKAAAQALRRRAEEISAIGATLLDIAATQDLQNLLQTMVARAVRLFEATGGSIYKVDLEQGEITCLLSYNCPTSQEEQVITFGQGATGQVAASGQPLLISDYMNWPGKDQFPGDTSKIMSLISAPLIWRSQVLGVLNVVHTETGHKFDGDDLDLLMLFANQAALAFENARLFEAEQRRAHEAETLRQAAALVAATLNPDEAIQLILEQLARVVPYDSASVQLLRDSYLEIVGGRGWPDLSTVVGERFPVPGNNPNTQVILEKKPLVVEIQQDDYPSFRRKSGQQQIASWLGVPLVVHESVIGMLAMDSRQENAFSDQHARLAAAFAGQVAIAMENARLFAEANQRADELTSLYHAAQDLGISLEPAVVLEQLARHLTQALDATSGRIVEMHPDTGLYTVLAEFWGPEAAPAEQVSCVGMELPIHLHLTEDFAYQSTEPVSYQANDAHLTDAEHRQLAGFSVKSVLIVPIVARGRTLGAAALWESRRYRDFTQAEKRLGQAMAQHGAGVIDNAHLYNAIRKRASEMDALRATLADLSSELELPRLLQAISERAVSMLGATGGDLGIFDENTQQIRIVVSHNLDKDYTGTIMGMGEGAMGYVAKSRQPLIINNYQEWDGCSPQYCDTPMHAVLAAPLLIGGNLVGALGIADKDPNRQFTYADQHLLMLFAQQAAIAIQNAKLYQEATRAAERRATLHQASQEIVTARLDSRAIYTAVYRAASRIMPTEAFVFTILDDETQTIQVAYMVDKNGEVAPVSFPAEQGLSGYVIATGLSIIIDNVSDFTTAEPLHLSEHRDVRSILAVPVRLGGAIKGMLSCQSYQPHAYTAEDRSLLETLAAYASIALENARLFREVQHMAVTDPLTGVNNRRHLYDLGQREFNRSLRYNRPLAAIMLDVDNFKFLNDNYGHNTGDLALIKIGQILQKNIRGIDILARYGGDEFVILLPETGAAAAQSVAERLTSAIVHSPLNTEHGDILLSVSLGYAITNGESPTLEALLGQADKAMYIAKEESRKRVSQQPAQSLG